MGRVLACRIFLASASEIFLPVHATLLNTSSVRLRRVLKKKGEGRRKERRRTNEDELE